MRILSAIRNSVPLVANSTSHYLIMANSNICCDTADESLFEESSSELHRPTNKYTVKGFVEQLLLFLVNLHSGKGESPLNA
jgi:hypothetical protein